VRTPRRAQRRAEQDARHEDGSRAVLRGPPATNNANLAGMRGASWRPLLVRRLLVAALVLVGEFAAFEWFLRWQAGTEAAPAFQQLFMQDDVIGYRLAPNQSVVFTTREFTTPIATNAQGVRDDDVGPKPPGERRVVVLGDSLVLAVQVPSAATFCARLQARLNHAAPAGVRYRVINAGVQGYGPVEELLFYRRVASHFDADLVLVATFVANDAVEAFDAAWRLDGSRPAAVAARQETERRMRRIVRRSMVLQIVRQRLDQLRHAGQDGGAPSRPVASYLVTPPPFISDGLVVATRALGTLAREVRADGARLAIALVPARFQLDPAEYTRLRLATEPAAGRLSKDIATERFHAALAPLGVPIVDLLPPLLAAPHGQFFAGTVHFTAAGHETVAAALEAFIRREHLLDVDERRPRADTN
jgi:lysophospholipase L1-like esterase